MINRPKITLSSFQDPSLDFLKKPEIQFSDSENQAAIFWRILDNFFLEKNQA